MMKKSLILLIFTFISIFSVKAQVVFGVRLGLSQTTFSSSYEDERESLKGKPSIEVGPTIYYSLKNNFYLNTGIMFSMKNFKVSESESGTSNDYIDGIIDTNYWNYNLNEKLNLYYLEVPFYLGYTLKFNKISLYAQAGPFLSIKIKEKYSCSESYSHNNSHFEYTNEDEDEGEIAKKINAGVGVMAGIDLSKFKIEIGYQQGLTNIAKQSENKIKIGSVFLGVSYIF